MDNYRVEKCYGAFHYVTNTIVLNDSFQMSIVSRKPHFDIVIN